MRVGGTLRRASANPVLKRIGIGATLLQAAKSLESAYQLFGAAIPRCFCSDLAQGIWIGERESAARSFIGNGVGAVVGAVGNFGTGPIVGRVISLLVAPVANFAAQNFMPDTFIRTVARTATPPPVLTICDDPLGLSYER